MKNWWRILILSTLLSMVAPVRAMLIQVDGSVSVHVLLVTTNLFIAYKEVTGTPKPEMFAYDLKARKVTWRQSCEHMPTEAIEDGSGAFYYDAENKLIKRNLKTGGLYWQVSLASIPQQVSSPSLKLSQKIKNKVLGTVGMKPITPLPASTQMSFGTPNRFYCKQMLMSGQNLFITRKAIKYSGGCVSTECFDDWLLLDAWKGALINGGDASVAGLGGGNILLQGGGSCIIRRGQREDWPGYHALQNSGYESSSFFSDAVLGTSAAKYAVVPKAYHSDDVFIVDEDGDIVATIVPKTNLSGRANWLVLDKYVFRFSESSIYHAGVNPGPPFRWFELYEPTGQLVISTTLQETPESCGFHSNFLGLTAKGEPVFEASDNLWRLEMPSLHCANIQRVFPIDAKWNESHAYSSYAMQSGSDVVFQVIGNVTFQEMAKPQMTHEISIRALDTKDFRELWKYSEQVTVVKQTNDVSRLTR